MTRTLRYILPPDPDETPPSPLPPPAAMNAFGQTPTADIDLVNMLGIEITRLQQVQEYLSEIRTRKVNELLDQGWTLRKLAVQLRMHKSRVEQLRDKKYQKKVTAIQRDWDRRYGTTRRIKAPMQREEEQ